MVWLDLPREKVFKLENGIFYEYIAGDWEKIGQSRNPVKFKEWLKREAENKELIILKEEPPSFPELREWDYEGVCEAVDGCLVEPDGYCPHGLPSWLRVAGVI